MAIHVGCGSWSDDAYVGVLYPPKTQAKRRLAVYATWFDHVEVNATYYAVPQAARVAAWLEETPAHFQFTIKLHRAFSRNPGKVAEEGDLIERTLAGVEPLVKAKRLSAYLLVLTADFAPGKKQLAELGTVAKKLHPHPLAVELRHNDWVNPENRDATLGYFREHGIAWVAVDMPRIKGSALMPAIDEVTHPKLAYLRLHGRNPGYLKAKTAAEGHTYEYSAEELAELVKRAEHLAASARNVYVVANNHAQDFAPKTALALKRLLGQPVREGP